MHLLEHPMNHRRTLRFDLHFIMTFCLLNVSSSVLHAKSLLQYLSHYPIGWQLGNQVPINHLTCPPPGPVDLWMCIAALCYFSSCVSNILAQCVVKDKALVSLVSWIISIHFLFLRLRKIWYLAAMPKKNQTIIIWRAACTIAQPWSS